MKIKSDETPCWCVVCAYDGGWFRGAQYNVLEVHTNYNEAIESLNEYKMRMTKENIRKFKVHYSIHKSKLGRTEYL